MSLTNPKIFGLNVRTLLADVENKNAAIQNLGINPLDLEIIKKVMPKKGRKYSAKQKKIARVAPPRDRITGADFKRLKKRATKKN